MFKKIIKFAVVFNLLICSTSQAHRPIFTDEKGDTPETAVKIAEPEVSQVIYRSLTDKAPQLWLQVDVESEFELFVQIGIPVVDRLKNYRPSFVVLGPGLSEISTPFSIPENIGGENYSTENIEKPRFFHEHFTDTDSWILQGETIKLPSPGKYYVVAYSPTEQKDKLWLSVGKKEKFGLLDILRFGGWKKTIQKFHEVGAERLMSMTIDDFTDPDHISALGTKWRLVTDRVMGGVSDGDYGFGRDEQFSYIKMTGNVSLENNGGFVQVALPLSKESKSLDATDFSGVRFWTKGNGEQYYIHLKNGQTRLPWQYYSAAFTSTEDWQQVEIPFDKFKPQALNSNLITDSLSQIAIVGAKKAYKINISVGPIEFYRNDAEK
jgi:hypothetical protein